mmetsp:Transcript_25511/g.33338  ORF Transcript_25511/g.33338 Transcript_25511/m.33338 type:complete len:89 (+) Transcript_25511:328-594(+)
MCKALITTQIIVEFRNSNAMPHSNQHNSAYRTKATSLHFEWVQTSGSISSRLMSMGKGNCGGSWRGPPDDKTGFSITAPSSRVADATA